MTYNVGLFFAVLAGHLIGSLAFGRFMKSNPEPVSVTEDCCSTNPWLPSESEDNKVPTNTDHVIPIKKLEKTKLIEESSNYVDWHVN
jgi:hypothetical protein